MRTAQMRMEIIRDGLVSVGPILCRWAQRQQRRRHTEPHSTDDTQQALEAGELLICQAQQTRERASARARWQFDIILCYKLVVMKRNGLFSHARGAPQRYRKCVWENWIVLVFWKISISHCACTRIAYRSIYWANHEGRVQITRACHS